MAKISVRVWAGYKEEPIMIRETDILEHKNVSELNISDDLKTAFQAWDDEYQDTFDDNYPPDSGFASQKLLDEHNQLGRQLSIRLQKELGDNYEVAFHQAP